LTTADEIIDVGMTANEKPDPSSSSFWFDEHSLLVPVDVLVEATLGLLLSIYGAVKSAGTFKPVDGRLFFNSFDLDDALSAPRFRIYNHRGRFIRQRIEKQ
jgi:hypothetical protein